MIKLGKWVHHELHLCEYQPVAISIFLRLDIINCMTCFYIYSHCFMYHFLCIVVFRNILNTVCVSHRYKHHLGGNIVFKKRKVEIY